MTDNRHSPKKTENQGPSGGNLGQKQAEREEAADEKLDHMGDKNKQPTKSRNEQNK